MRSSSPPAARFARWPTCRKALASEHRVCVGVRSCWRSVPTSMCSELRGNVGTRLRKIDEGQVDAALLAAAGLKRLGLGDRIVSLLDPPEWLQCAGTGCHRHPGA